ncbi:hypothetical protein ACHAXA_011611 [Cyclostephanos tholiformis]|uniref:RNA polymerase sigma-70 region 2 domain-containing protein n=1 Tax=Cyclostephanos tholiformis TaxID=382380 RepID=A0ABD3RV86_9STRA
MLDHAVLTREMEVTYGRRIVAARELRCIIDSYLEEKRVLRADDDLDDDEGGGGEDDDDDGVGGGGNDNLDYDFLSFELEYLSVYGYRRSVSMTRNNGIDGIDGIDGDVASSSYTSLGGYDLDDDLLIEHAQHLSRHVRQLRRDESNLAFVEKKGEDYVHDNGDGNGGGNGGGGGGGGGGGSKHGKGNGGKFKRGDGPRGQGSSAANRNSYTSALQIPLHELSEFEVIYSLNVTGGKSELVRILLDGAHAREALMRGNVKLVMSIAKGWMRNSYAVAGSNGEGAPGGGYAGGNGISGRMARRQLSQMYEGSWDRPSLDEAVQEGMLGLARAVDKYDPERGLRFSTYATHWITSYVRTCFQRAVTGCLRVPSQLHEIKAAYNQIVRDHLHLSGEGGGSGSPAIAPLDRESIAQRLGISERRLRIAIRATGTLLSVDAPVMSAGGGSGGGYKGSMAGGDGRNNQELLILDTLKCAEPKPEDQVEISFLRQCLENAMATELTPYERDILRLRLGLDSGEGKTVREIVELSGGIVSMADVRSAERRAFKKLRSPASVHTHNLLAYLNDGGYAEI